MRNGREVYDLQEDMEYKPVCEDSKVRVYLSLVRSEDERKRRAMEARRRNRKKRIARKMIAVGIELLKVILAVAAALILMNILAAYLYVKRGYVAVGSEYIFSALFGVAVWCLLDKLEKYLGGDMYYDK